MRILLGLLLSIFCFTCSSAADSYRLEYTRIESGEMITGHGTAFAIKPRLLLTAAHNCLNDGQLLKTIRVEVSGKWIPVEVVKILPDVDIATLRTAQDVPVNGELGDDPDSGDDVNVSGSIRGEAITSKSGSVLWPYDKGGIKTLAEVEHFDHGVSGGPVLNSKGKIVGMAVSGVPKDGDLDHRRVQFVPASVLKWFLKRQSHEEAAQATVKEISRKD